MQGNYQAKMNLVKKRYAKKKAIKPILLLSFVNLFSMLQGFFLDLSLQIIFWLNFLVFYHTIY